MPDYPGSTPAQTACSSIWYSLIRATFYTEKQSAHCAQIIEVDSILYAGNGDYAPDAIIYSMLIDKPAIYMLGRCEQKGY